MGDAIYTTINFTSELGNVSVALGCDGSGRLICGWLGVVVARNFTCWAWSTHASVSASQQEMLSGRGARVYTCTRVRDNIACRRLPK